MQLLLSESERVSRSVRPLRSGPLRRDRVWPSTPPSEAQPRQAKWTRHQFLPGVGAPALAVEGVSKYLLS